MLLYTPSRKRVGMRSAKDSASDLVLNVQRAFNPVEDLRPAGRGRAAKHHQ